ncbi:DUF1190 domain-containing protein [Tistrella mobilis]|uniref:DUF1190 domain-containing protein n=1 Tax=Tistrella mobilis TaxID=171437 RepID=A0A162L664_9PROT|nr:DUF1190 domain-containing protein [Tistrella mobilis]KYO53480.1 hypothetical protein AUP44_03805 [Tistrella mobilis]
MRRSRAVTTLLIAGTALTLAGCGEDTEQVKIYGTSEACSAEMTAADCAAAEAEAREAHIATAPRFDSLAACEEDFGADGCQPVPQQQASSGGSFFMPAFAGFMLGRMMGGGGGFHGRPVYVDRNGYMYSGADRFGQTRRENVFRNGRPTNWAGSANVARSTVSNPVKPAGTVSPARRSGGFGATGARGYSFGG